MGLKTLVSVSVHQHTDITIAIQITNAMPIQSVLVFEFPLL